MHYSVSRDGTALLTLHEGTDTTACGAAREELTGALEELAESDALAGWEIRGVEVYEHPTAPFEPYTVELSFAVTATVEAADDASAAARGEAAIETALGRAGIDAVRYGASAVASVS